MVRIRDGETPLLMRDCRGKDGFLSPKRVESRFGGGKHASPPFVIPSRHGRQRLLAKPRARCTTIAGLVDGDDIFDVIPSVARDLGGRRREARTSCHPTPQVPRSRSG